MAVLRVQVNIFMSWVLKNSVQLSDSLAIDLSQNFNH